VKPLRVRETMLAWAVSSVEERVPTNGVVGGPELWERLALHTGLRVVPSARFRPAGNGPIWGSPSDKFAIWSASGMEYVVLENEGWFIGRHWTKSTRTAPARSSFRPLGAEACAGAVWVGTTPAGPLSCLEPSVVAVLGIFVGSPLDLTLLRGIDLFPFTAPQ
jgi:hypothetical protein